ncbi:tRNA (adenosine(37)-N6)-dimethylallyltransferase MiaA [soil metagenome]
MTQRGARHSLPAASADRVPIVAVVGATASGKTALSLDLAESLGGHIINTDAMAVYRGMDIGTAKPSVAERRGITHHLLDFLDVTEPLTVAEFQARARAVIADLRAEAVTPVLVGGSPLYTRAVLDQFDFPGTDPAVRARLEAELEAGGEAPLRARLADRDPVAESRIELGNGRRIVRALEVIEITGKPFSARLPKAEYADPRSIQIGVAIDRAALAARIEQRVEAMFEAGLVDEVAGLIEAGLLESRTAAVAIGYREVAAHLAGVLTLAEAQDKTIAATRKFARRQDSWFRNDPRVVWVDHDDPARVVKALAAIAAVAQQPDRAQD